MRIFSSTDCGSDAFNLSVPHLGRCPLYQRGTLPAAIDSENTGMISARRALLDIVSVIGDVLELSIDVTLHLVIEVR